MSEVKKMIEDIVLPAPDCRALTNPPMRRELRADFPRTLRAQHPQDAQDIVKAAAAELKKHGTTLDRVGHITLAYPHKHPEIFPGHYNGAEATAQILSLSLQKVAPSVQWLMADEICETAHLDRSTNQTSVHALMCHQIYDIHKPSQKNGLIPFLDPGNTAKEFFIVVDGWQEQGTTLANFISYIEHNGGSVLAAATSSDPMALVQDNKCAVLKRPLLSLSEKFNDAARNTEQLPDLARFFSHSAKESGFDWSPAECLELFEAALNRNGNSVFSLTNGECVRLINTINRDYYLVESFPGLLKKLDQAPVTPKF